MDQAIKLAKSDSVGAGNVHVDSRLSSVAVNYMQSSDRHFASRIFPPVPVAHQSDLYTRWNIGYALRDEMHRRADGDPVHIANDMVATDSYRCDVYDEARMVTDRARANADPGINLESVMTERCMDSAMRKLDKLFITEFFKTGVWETDIGGKPNLGGDNVDTIKLIRGYVSQLLAKRPMSRRDVVIAMPHLVYEAIANSEDVISRVNRGQTTGPASVTAETMAALFDVGSVVEMMSIENRGDEGAADDIGFIAAAGMLIAGRAPAPSTVMPSAGYIFSWTAIGGSPTPGGASVKKWYSDEREATIVRAQIAPDMKVVDAGMGLYVEAPIGA